MYTLHLLVKFRKDVSPEWARSEWLGDHGQLALTLPGLRRYIQHHWVAPIPGYDQPYDGTVEVSFDDEAAMRAAFASPVGAAMIKDDLRVFDRSDDPAYVGAVVESHVMLDVTADRADELASAAQ